MAPKHSRNTTASNNITMGCHLMKFIVLSLAWMVIICVVSSSGKSLDLTHDLDTSNSYLEHHHSSHQSQHHQSHNLHHNRNRRLQRRDSTAKDGMFDSQHCQEARGYFESIDIKMPQHFNEKGK